MPNPDSRFSGLFAPGEPRVITVIGTGASLTPEQIATAKRRKTIACNRAYTFNADVMHACNWQFWDVYHDDAARYRCVKWTTRPESAEKYPDVNYIAEKWEPGLSTDPSYVCAHHGTGPQAVNLALHYGAKKIILIGWDMIFRGKVDRRTYTAPRRYFDEDSITRNHWPNTDPDGSLGGLIREMETIKPADYGVDIVNCSPGSAMKCFRMSEIEREIEAE